MQVREREAHARRSAFCVSLAFSRLPRPSRTGSRTCDTTRRGLWQHDQLWPRLLRGPSCARSSCWATCCLALSISTARCSRQRSTRTRSTSLTGRSTWTTQTASTSMDACLLAALAAVATPSAAKVGGLCLNSARRASAQPTSMPSDSAGPCERAVQLQSLRGRSRSCAGCKPGFPTSSVTR